MIFYGIGLAAMAKPSLLITAQQSMAPDLSADRTISTAATSPRRRDLVFIVNPKGYISTSLYLSIVYTQTHTYLKLSLCEILRVS